MVGRGWCLSVLGSVREVMGLVAGNMLLQGRVGRVATNESLARKHLVYQTQLFYETQTAMSIVEEVPCPLDLGMFLFEENEPQQRSELEGMEVLEALARLTRPTPQS
jgi:hypothetical protein